MLRPTPLLPPALLLVLVLRASLAAAFALPPWAKPLPQRHPMRIVFAKHNREVVAAVNAAGERLDIAMLGDSITSGRNSVLCVLRVGKLPCSPT